MAHAPAAKKQTVVPSTTPHPVPQFSGLLESGKYSDLTLTCGSRSWKLHKGVLCLQSDFFARACDGGFREAHTNTIDLSEDNEQAVHAMIYFMYHGRYGAEHVLSPAEYEGGGSMLLHVRVVSLAQKYFIEPLQEYAGEFAVGLMETWDGASPIFAESVLATYTGTQDVAFGTTLREVSVEVAVKHALLIFEPGNEHLSRTRKILLDDTPGFMEDWTKAMSHSIDRLSAMNTNVELVNDILERDNSKVNDQRKNLEATVNQLKAEADHSAIASKAVWRLYIEISQEKKDLEQKMEGMVNIPDFPIASSYHARSGRTPDCYMCPNCEVLFFEAILSRSFYEHPCFDHGWRGKLGKASIELFYTEWQKHLVRKAYYPS